MDELRIVSGWTPNNHWVVVGPMYGQTVVVFDPSENRVHPILAIRACNEWIEDQKGL